MQKVDYPMSDAARSVVAAINQLDPSVRAEVVRFLRSGDQVKFEGYKVGPAPATTAQAGGRVCQGCGRPM
jgi:hypothetical protein